MLSYEQRKLLEQEDLYWFEDLFYRDIESWFLSDIACCDECYDDFLAYWPLAYTADQAAFQRCAIDLECFYSGSRQLRECYTKQEFFKYLQLISCPRCGSELKYNIWPYTLPFNIVDNFEIKIKEIAKISQNTPFLLLKSPFANEVYETIKKLANESVPKPINSSLHRARTKISLKSNEINEFDFPPENLVSEGRYNHAGSPVLYMASDPETCFFEMREAPCIIAEVRIHKEIKILDLSNACDSHNKHSDFLNTLIYSALMSAHQSNSRWYKSKYVFTRFIKDCAKSAEFDAIQYPSTRKSGKSFNIVIINYEFSLKNSSTLVKLVSFEKNHIQDIENI